MHPISSQDESWFPVFDWRFEPTFHQHLKWSFHSATGKWEGPCVSCLKWKGPGDTLTQKKAGFPCSVLIQARVASHKMKGCLNTCGDHRESHSSPPHLDSGNHITLSGGTRSSRLQKVTMPDYFCKWIGIAISLVQLESEPWSPASPPEESVLSYLAYFRFLRCPS